MRICIEEYFQELKAAIIIFMNNPQKFLNCNTSIVASNISYQVLMIMVYVVYQDSF